jgi:hypothetical protein
MSWHFIYLVVHLLWDCFRFSRLAPDDNTLELLLLRQQRLILRRHQKRGPTITRTEIRAKFPLGYFFAPYEAA